MLSFKPVGYWLARGLPPILFLTFFWQTRVNLFSIHEAFDYHIPFIYLSDILILSILLGEFFLDPPWLIRELKSAQWWTRIVIIFVTYVMVSIFWSVKLVPAVYAVTKIILFLGFAVWISRFVRLYSLQKIAVLMSIGLAPIVFLGAIEMLLGQSLGIKLIGEWNFSADTPGIAQTYVLGSRILRPYGTFPHPNVFGGVMAIMSFIWLYSLVNEIHSKKRDKLAFGWVFFLIFLFGTFISFSRSAWIALFLSVVLFFIYPICIKFIRKQHLKIDRSSLVLLLLVSVLALIIAWRTQVLFSWDNLALLRREGLNQVAFSMWADHLLWGVGPNQFIVFVEKYWNVPNVFLVMQPVHNIILLILSELGLSGFALWLGTILLPVLVSYRKLPIVLSSAWLIIAATGMVDHYWWTLQAGLLMLFLTLGLTLATMKENEIQ